MGKKLNEVKEFCGGMAEAAAGFEVVSNDDIGEAWLGGFLDGLGLMAFFLNKAIEDDKVGYLVEDGDYKNLVVTILRRRAEHLEGRDE